MTLVTAAGRGPQAALATHTKQPGVMWRSDASARTETPGVFMLLAAFAAVFLLVFFARAESLVETFGWPIDAFWPASLRLWQPFTFPFIHWQFFGLLADGLVLYFFGGSLERAWGTTRFMAFFFLSGLVAGTAILILTPLHVAALFTGMRGGFVALVVAFAALNPYAAVILVVIPMQARWLAALAVAWELFGNFAAYGGPFPALVSLGAVCAFAWLFTNRRLLYASSFRRRGPTMRERLERWQQRRRMRNWQRRISRASRPEDLFRDR